MGACDLIQVPCGYIALLRFLFILNLHHGFILLWSMPPHIIVEGWEDTTSTLQQSGLLSELFMAVLYSVRTFL